MKVTIKTPPVERIVTIEMSEDAAQSLRIICDRIGGDPDTSGRRHFDNLKKALDMAGIHCPPGGHLREYPRSHIMFLNQETFDGLA